MGKHNKHPDRSPGRNNNDLAANEPSKAKLAYKIIIFATATVKLITEILHCIGSSTRNPYQERATDLVGVVLY